MEPLGPSDVYITMPIKGRARVLTFCFVLLSISGIFALSIALKARRARTRGVPNWAITAADRRRAEIKRELSHLRGSAWAGDYYYGDGLGYRFNLMLAPRSGYVYTWHGCLGLYGVDYGTVSWRNGVVSLTSEYRHRNSTKVKSDQFYPLEWGERHYLIPEGDLVEFCNQVNAGIEPNDNFQSSAVPLKAGDGEKSVTGRPPVPEGYDAYLLSRPID